MISYSLSIKISLGKQRRKVSCRNPLPNDDLLFSGSQEFGLFAALGRGSASVYHGVHIHESTYTA